MTRELGARRPLRRVEAEVLAPQRGRAALAASPEHANEYSAVSEKPGKSERR